jgi:hypothetical protein
MMQSIDTKFRYHSIVNVISLLLVIITNPSISFANSQFEIKGFDILGEDSAGSKNYNKAFANSYINYIGTYNLSENMQLLLQENYDGIFLISYKRDTVSNRLSPVAERNVLSSNTAGLGLRFTKLGDAQILIKNLWYIDTMSIYPSFAPKMYGKHITYDSLTSDSIANGLLYYDQLQMIRTSRTNMNLYWALPIGPMVICADLNYFFLNYINPVKLSNSSVSDSVIRRDKITDVDQFLNVSIRYNLSLDFHTELGTNLKHNLSDLSFSNLYRYYLSVGGDHSLPLDNKLTWSADAQWYMRAAESTMPQDYASKLVSFNSNIPKSLIYRIYVRDVFTIAWGVFLKATAILDLSDQLFKQRYELAIRKAWENSSYIDAGYFAALNGLFPMQGPYLRTRFCPIPALEICGTTKFIWQQSALYNENGELDRYKYSYLKNVTGGELSYRLPKYISILGGIDYTYFSNSDFLEIDNFPSRMGGYIGIRGSI